MSSDDYDGSLWAESVNNYWGRRVDSNLEWISERLIYKYGRELCVIPVDY